MDSTFKKGDKVIKTIGQNRGREAEVKWTYKESATGEPSMTILYDGSMNYTYYCRQKNYVLAPEYKPGKPYKPNPGRHCAS